MCICIDIDRLRYGSPFTVMALLHFENYPIHPCPHTEPTTSSQDLFTPSQPNLGRWPDISLSVLAASESTLLIGRPYLMNLGNKPPVLSRPGPWVPSDPHYSYQHPPEFISSIWTGLQAPTEQLRGTGSIAWAGPCWYPSTPNSKFTLV